MLSHLKAYLFKL